MIARKRLTVQRAQNRLATLWAASGAGLVFVMVLWSFSYVEGVKGFDWLLPNLMPTLTLIMGVVGREVVKKSRGRAKSVNPMAYRFALGASVLYLSILGLFMFFPLVFVAGKTFLDFTEGSQTILGVLQGVVAATVGNFFLSEESPEEGE